MAVADSAIDREALAYARALLRAPLARESPWPVLGAAGLCAVAALAFAFAMVVAPPTTKSHLVIEDEAAGPAPASESAVVQAAPAQP
jgi:hypothetical protein